MKLKLKFNLVMLVVFSVAFATSGYFSHRQLNENARNEVLSNAGVLMETILSARNWAVNEVGPNLREAEEDEGFLMMGVPAYAAEKIMEDVKKRYPDYDYREAVLNPLNTKHLAAQWEKKLIDQFRADKTLNQLWGVRSSSKGSYLYLARPIDIPKVGCLGCHTTPEKSPTELVRMYGTQHGYGWKLKEIVGAQVVTVPLAVPVANAQRSFTAFMTTLGLVFVVLFIVIDFMLSRLVISPLNRMAAAADEISKGNLKVEEFSEKGKDEVAHLAASFNRMKRSLEKATALFYSQGNK
jgi:HAMP domain-containing protein